MRRSLFLLGVALLLASAAVGEDTATPTTTDPAQQAINARWQELRAKAEAGNLQTISGAAVFDPKAMTQMNERELYLHGVEARLTIQRTLKDRQFTTDAEREFKSLFDPGRPVAAKKLMDDNPRVNELLWNAAMGGPSGEAQLKRLLEQYGAAKASQSDLTLKAFLLGLDEKGLMKVLAGEKVEEKKEEGRPAEKKPGEKKPAAGTVAGDAMASVGFDGSQAYGVPGDRHVYQDKAGNSISLSITSRRMLDGTLEDVIHVVNINNRSAPRGATFSLRSDFEKLQAGVPVTVGGVSFTLKLKANGDDHALEMSGPNGPFTNLKEPREPPMSLSQLYAYRAARVFSYGRVVDVGGKEYYVSPETYTQIEGQADALKHVGYGQFSYWPKDEMDKLFAAKPGRDEVDPQTFDFKKLDLAGSKYMGVRGFRPDLAATVIRREGAQDVAMPRASLGKDEQGRWWDAVLKDGQYSVQPGVEPKPGSPGFPAPPEEETRLGRFGPGLPDNWAVVRDRNNQPLDPAPGFPVPLGKTPGVAAYTNAEKSILYIRSSFKDKAGTIWTSGPQETFALKAGVPKMPPLPSVPLKMSPFVTDVPIGSFLTSTVHVFDEGKSGYMVLQTKKDDSVKDFSPIGIPVIWGDKFASPQAAFDYNREHPLEGIDHLLSGGTP